MQIRGATTPKPTLLFVYYARHEWPLRAVLHAQKSAWERLSGFDVVSFNVAYPVGMARIARLSFQAVVYHSTALTLRWYPGGLAPLDLLATAFASKPTLKIAMPHDDYLFSTSLVRFFNHARVDIVLSVLPSDLWRKVYAGLDFSRTRISPALTHYIDDSFIELTGSHVLPLSARTSWLRYRATAPRAWTGAWGQLKLRVGEAALAAANRRGRNADISLDALDAVRGEAWYAFLAGARATVGVEGGSSIFDPDGRIFNTVEAFARTHPDAAYAEIVQKLLPEGDDMLRATAISPRHLEAAATKTAQILVQGEYSGVLEPWTHYIPVKHDLSDMDAALEALEDDALVSEMIERAYTQVTSPRFSWTHFFATLFPSGLPDSHPTHAHTQTAEFEAAKALERQKMHLIPLELALGKSPAWARKIARVVLGRDGFKAAKRRVDQQQEAL